MSNVKKKYQVFISSTFTDLQVERRELTMALLDQYIPSGMEAFPASPERGWRTIRAAIDDSDYYVLILAGLYGSVDSQTGISWTQREYEYAQEKGIPTLAFVRAEGSIPVGSAESDEQKKELLDKFRGAVTGAFLCKDWTSSDSLIRHVKDSLGAAVRDKDFGNRPGWYRGALPDQLQVLAQQPRKWNLQDALRVELISDDSNSVLLRNRETSVKYWLRLLNLAPFEIKTEKISLKWLILMGDRLQEGTKDVIEPFETLGPAKQQIIGVDLSIEPCTGKAPALARLAAVGSVVAAAPELGGRVSDSIGSFVYGRVADERTQGLKRGMSQEAEEYMVAIARAYRDNGFPNHNVWMIDKGQVAPKHTELMNLHRFIRLMGARGSAYLLTDAGFRWVREYLASTDG